jgi:hypothetical protein
MTTTQHSPSRVTITIDIYDEPLITVPIWARQSAHRLTAHLCEHGVLAHLANIEIDTHPIPSRPTRSPFPAGPCPPIAAN